MATIGNIASPRGIPVPAGGHPGGWITPAGIRRAAKFAAAGIVLAVGLYAALANQGYVVTDNAVVSAYRVSLRTPIAGRLEGLSVPVGTEIAAGTVIARIHSRRVDDQRLADLLRSLDQSRADLTAEYGQRARLAALRGRLDARAAADLSASRDQLRGLLLQAEGTLRQDEARRDLARIRLARIMPLLANGVATPAARDAAAADLAAATAAVASDRGQLAALVARAAAVTKGILLDNGGNDVPYSAQRADEIAITMARLDGEIVTSRARVENLDTAIAAERERLAVLSRSELRAPSAGIVWKLDAVAGEHLAAGKSVAELVDCGRPVVLAAISEDDAARIALGSRVRMRLAGEATDRSGRVVAIGGAALRDQGRALAATPQPRNTPRQIVWIALDAPPAASSACLIGRTLRVMIPEDGEGAIERWIARVF